MTTSWLVSLDDYNEVLKVNEDTKCITVQSGIRLFQLHRVLDSLGWAMPNLGTISSQSIAGAISTATHGSSLHHGLISDDIESLTILLSNGTHVTCIRDGTTTPNIFNDESDPTSISHLSLFRAALCSLGALGIITSITFRARKAFNLAWTQSLHPHTHIITHWSSKIFNQAEYERVWWYPYTGRCLLWQASHTNLPLTPTSYSWFGTSIGYHINQIMLYTTVWFPSLTPLAEKLMFLMQYTSILYAKDGQLTGVSTSVDGMSMNCLYRQYVNEWSIPLHHGPEALHRFQSWLNGKPYDVHKIPFDNKGVYAHSPIEVRPSFPAEEHRVMEGRPYLDTHQYSGDATTSASGAGEGAVEPSLYINATLFKPYGAEIPGRKKFYEAFEWLMLEYGGRPHWAKNWTTVDRDGFRRIYKRKLEKWLEVREKVDEDGVFLNDFVKKFLVGSGVAEEDEEEVEEMFDETGVRRPDVKGKGKAKEVPVAGGVLTSGLLRRASDGSSSDATMTSSGLAGSAFEHLRASEADMSFFHVDRDSPPPFATL